MGINQQDGPAVVGLDILAVDDEPVITRILQALLSKVGHRVTISGGGDHARELLKTRRFDLLITDKNMPDLSGLELSRLARASHPSIIIIMIVMTAMIPTV